MNYCLQKVVLLLIYILTNFVLHWILDWFNQLRSQDQSILFVYISLVCVARN